MKIWEKMERLSIATFPRPIIGRIPNFIRAEEAAKKLRELPEFKRARVVKVNPDSPQRPVRFNVLSSGKILVMPTPRLREGFLLLDPQIIPERFYDFASSIKGAFRFGRLVKLDEIPKVDLVVAGSVAVSQDGSRIGKGGGYSEIEFAVLREKGLVNESTPVVTTVHDIQIVDGVPQEDHDVPVDVIITPTQVIKTHRKRPKPKGVIWEKVTSEMMEDMPVLKELVRMKKS